MSGHRQPTSPSRTDAYFTRTREVVERFGDMTVTYAVFLRRPVIAASRPMMEWLDEVAPGAATTFDLRGRHAEGDWVGAGEPIAYITGSFAALADTETLFLQKLGAACVAAHNAYQMCLALPGVRLPGHGGPALRRRRDAGADGLRRRRRQRRRAA